jgi:polar amino acid transport system substrate-binding protein
MGLCAWTPEGSIGRFLPHRRGVAAAPPGFVDPPPAWGDEEHVRELFEGTGIPLAFQRETSEIRHRSVSDAVDCYATKYGPVVQAFELHNASGGCGRAPRAVAGIAVRLRCERVTSRGGDCQLLIGPSASPTFDRRVESTRKGTTMTERDWSRRDFLRRTMLAGAAVVGGPVLLSACSQVPSGGGGGGQGGASTLEAARSAGMLRVGIANEAPYGFTDPSGNVTGESVEVGRAVLRAIGIGDIQATTVEFGSLIPALNARQFDMVTAGMFINPQRCANAAFSIPDYTAPTAFLVPAGNPQGVRTFDDVVAKNLRLAVVSGAVEQGYATDSGVPEAQLQVLDSQNSLFQAVTAGRADAAALTNISLNDIVTKNPGAAVEVTPGFFPTIDGEETVSAGAFVFRQGEDELLQAFNTELKRLQDSGEWLRIARPFGFTQDNVPGPEVTTERLCAA